MKTDTPLGALLLLLVMPLIVVAGGLFNGWVSSTLWGWFAVEQFGLPAVSVTQAWGLALIVTFFRGTPRPLKADLYANENWVGYLGLYGFGLLVLGIGWCLHAWMVA